MPKKLLLLRSAINAIENENTLITREQQYINGIKSLKSFNVDGKFDDVWLVDNTYKGNERIARSIRTLIPETWSILCPETNKYGTTNKGAGDIETLQSLYQKIAEHDFLFFHELRLIIEDPQLIREFLDNPGNYIYREKFSWHEVDLKIPKKSAISGHYGISCNLFLSFLQTTDLQFMAASNIAIEDLLYQFVISNRLGFVPSRKYCSRYIERLNRYVRY